MLLVISKTDDGYIRVVGSGFTFYVNSKKDLAAMVKLIPNVERVEFDESLDNDNYKPFRLSILTALGFEMWL